MQNKIERGKKDYIKKVRTKILFIDRSIYLYIYYRYRCQ